jgi:hypothetical protein
MGENKLTHKQRFVIAQLNKELSDLHIMRSALIKIQIILNQPNYPCSGLCSAIGATTFHGNEFHMMHYYMNSNIPIMCRISMDFKRVFNYGNAQYWWTPYNLKPRLKWLKKHIRKTEERILKLNCKVLNLSKRAEKNAS